MREPQRPGGWDDDVWALYLAGWRDAAIEAQREPELMQDADAVVERLRHEHWLLFDKRRRVVGCQCGMEANPDDVGYGDSIANHLIWIGATEVMTAAPAGLRVRLALLLDEAFGQARLTRKEVWAALAAFDRLPEESP